MTGKELGRHRRRLGMTQQELGKLLDVHLVTVNRWEKGHVPVPRPVATLLPLLRPIKGRRTGRKR